MPYYHTVIELANLFDGFNIGHVSRSQNTKADALAALAIALALSVDAEYHLRVATRHLVCSKHMLRTREAYNILTDLEPSVGDFPSSTMLCMICNPKEAASMRRRSLHFYYDPTLKTLYRRSYDGILLCCLSNSEAQEVLKEAHDGICGAHQPGPKLKDRLHRLGSVSYTHLTLPTKRIV